MSQYRHTVISICISETLSVLLIINLRVFFVLSYEPNKFNTNALVRAGIDVSGDSKVVSLLVEEIKRSSSCVASYKNIISSPQ